jgi:hypothetical protein
LLVEEVEVRKSSSGGAGAYQLLVSFYEVQYPHLGCAELTIEGMVVEDGRKRIVGRRGAVVE